MDHNVLSRLSDRELLLHADNARDPLTTTDIEIELTTRFTHLVGLTEIEEAVKDVGIDVADVPAIVKLLDDHNATRLEFLREKLERADKFYDIANDAGDVIDRINSLINATI